MLRLFTLALAAFVFLNASSPGIARAEAAAALEAEAQNERSIDVLNLVTPIVKDGRLANYLFLNLRIHLSQATDVWRARAKGHFLRDALLKASHREQLTRNDDSDTLDEPATIRVVKSVSEGVLGPNTVTSVEILGVTALSSRTPARH